MGIVAILDDYDCGFNDASTQEVILIQIILAIFDDHLGFSIGMILTIFDLQITPTFPTKFQINLLFIQEKFKIVFHDGGHGSHLGFLIRTIFSIFDL